jgi:hypothetical protein
VVGVTETIGGTPPGGTIAVTGAPLTRFLQSRFDDGCLATFILSNDDATDRGYGIGTKEGTDPATAPVLTVEYTPVPEPSGAMLVLAAVLGGVMVRRR